jgi:hypothetical protein
MHGVSGTATADGAVTARRVRRAFTVEVEKSLARYAADRSVGNRELKRLYAARNAAIEALGGTPADTLAEQTYPNSGVRWVDEQLASAAVQLVSAYAASAVAKWHRRAGDLRASDEWGTASLAVYKALRVYNPAKGTFTEYAKRTISRDVRRFVQANEFALSDADFALRPQMLAFADEFAATHGRHPSPADIADQFNVSAARAERILGGAGLAPLPASALGDISWSQVLETAPASSVTLSGPDEIDDLPTVGEVLRLAKQTLTPEEYFVFQARLTVVDGKPRSFQSIADDLAKQRGDKTLSYMTAQRLYTSCETKLRPVLVS